jgi:hypothetical protein
MSELTNRHRAVLARLVSVLCALAVLAACTKTSDGSDGSTTKSEEQIAAEWAAEFEAARAAATSDFEREVLADDKITAAEYEEAVQRFVSCMKETLPPEFADGYQAVRNEYGVYQYNGPRIHESQSAAWEAAHTAAFDACRLGTTAQIEQLYTGMILNPKRMTPDEQILDCLKRHGVVEESYTMDNYRADQVANFGEDAVFGDYDPNQATGLDLDTEEATNCMVRPWA